MGELLLCEHEPVFTFGLRDLEYKEKVEELKQLGCDVVKVRRHLPHCVSLSELAGPMAPHAGEERWTDHLPWPRTAGVLPHPQPAEAEGKDSYQPFPSHHECHRCHGCHCVLCRLE